MPDIEKVIKGLTQCTSFGEIGLTEEECNDCPYCEGYKTGLCWVQMNRDVLELLKDQGNQIHHLTLICEEHEKELQKQPQIVRCKDCKHGQYEEWDNGECVDKTVYCDGYGIHKPDWFCGDGRCRKNDALREV